MYLQLTVLGHVVKKLLMATLFSNALFLPVHIIIHGVDRRVNIGIDLKGVSSE
jgi:hypothetical protein